MNGCPRYDWVSLTDQAATDDTATIPAGFTRPNKVSFPVFTFAGESELNINCQIFVCLNNSPDCNIDFTNCLQLNGNDPLERKRRSVGTTGGQTVVIYFFHR